jgi:hypothetical protein
VKRGRRAGWRGRGGKQLLSNGVEGAGWRGRGGKMDGEEGRLDGVEGEVSN